MDELRPAIDEYNRLEAAHRALEGVNTGGGRASSSASTRRSRGGGGSSGAGTGKRGRPKGSGARAEQARELVRGNPGITIPEMAQQMGIQQNYLYRVLPDLEQRGEVRKEGRGWYPKDA